MTRSFVATLFLSLLVLAGGCSGSHEDVQAALDRAQKGLDVANSSLEVTSSLYERYCTLQPECKVCKGETAQRIRAALVLGPLTVGEVKGILADVAAIK